MTALPKEYIFYDTHIASLSVYDLLKHIRNGSFVERKDFQHIFPLSLELNAGVFTKTEPVPGFPRVAVSQVGNALHTSCSCTNDSGSLCEHQAEVIHCIIEQKDYRIFFDGRLRRSTLLKVAKAYGLDMEPDLDTYFRIAYEHNRLHIEPRNKGLLPIDGAILQKELAPQQQSALRELALADTHKKRILVIGKHRYYNRSIFLLMQADLTRAGNIKNPVSNVDPSELAWKANDPLEIKFYAAIASFQHRYEEGNASELEALRLIARNPAGLQVYYHDRDLTETISVKSLLPVKLCLLKAEIKLMVFKKEPFYEVTGELLLNDDTLPFGNVIVRNEYFVCHKQVFHLVDNPDMLRVIKFFKSNNEILLVHESKYDEFLRTVLAPLERLVHINYSYIHPATPAQLAEVGVRAESIIYLHQEGNFISVTPVLKYGAVEVPVYSRKQVWDVDKNGNEFRIERDNEAETRLTSLVMAQHPDFKGQIEEYEYFYLHKDKFLDDSWFLDAFEAWRREGIAILGFNELKDNKRNPHRANVNVEVSSGIDWFNARLKVSFGKSKAALKQVHKAIRNQSKFVQLDDGTQGMLPDEWIEKISRYFEAGDIDGELLKIPKISFSEIADLFDKEVLDDETQAEIAAYGRRFAAIENVPQVNVPEALQAELRDYQRQGLNWLDFLDNFNFGGCLADDMGLGKTLQIIAFILSQREKHGHTTNLVVMPTSLLTNWREELAKFAPSVTVLLHHGAERRKSTADLSRYEVVLTSYGMLLSDIAFLKSFRFNYIFLDESQAIKNPNSERYKAARLLQSRNKIVLTGTPVENNTFDLYGQLSFACPGLLGSKQHFRDMYAIPIDKFQSSKNALALQRKIEPFILRRTKRQVAGELPEKTEMIIYCEMNARQREIYDTHERQLREFISAADDDDIRKSNMHVLAGLTRLRQICNSPILLQNGYSGEHAVKIEVLTGQIENKSREHKILVFSQFVGMLDLIKAELQRRSILFEYLTGQTTDRGAKVRNFQANEDIRVFLISLKAGGVGLNLTEADYVYLVDPWWNPAVENQAIDRSHRIGQNKHVVAVRLICSGTIEEKIMNLQKRKDKLAQDLVRTDASFFNNLSKDELLEIL